MEETLLPLFGFAIATSVTPGPNVLMVAASAANHGLRATWPHMIGVTLGFSLMLLLVGLGLAGPFAASPALHEVLHWVGTAWLIWLAIGIARAGGPEEGRRRPPMGVVAAGLFQWVNPKAWMIAVAAVPAFTTPGGDLLAEVSRIAVVFAIVCLPCLLVWAGLGAAIRRLLRHPGTLRAFNVTMAVLLVASLLPMVFSG
ncbi:LysE family translocator [Roseomonas hellenica]|uniref:LysE family translocator n=1 Tax=Plastoroseomonas hellenica TaxID=2687306 RepID=A0ABS5F7T3_9PROT|nr:LysE family translocator [Plastoroseomonas hellenica]MBR0668628.1 LysE family translocator [Plastoroseomonas hellenica]